MVSMSKMSNALINNAGRLAGQDDGVVGNLRLGAQYGFCPHLATIDASTPLVLRPLIYVVTHVPGMFKYVPGFTEMTKLFFEELAHSIDNVTIQYQNEGHQVLAMADGQQLTAPSDTKRSNINPSVVTTEYVGNICWNFIQRWMIMIKDPDTQAASLAGIIGSDVYIPPHTFSVFSVDLTGIQHDTTMRTKNIVDGFQLTAMHPQDTGDAGYKREVGTSSVPDRSFSFHAVLQHNANTYAAAANISQTLGLHKVNAQFATPCAEDVESLIQNYGLKREAANAISNFVPLGADAQVLSA